MDTKLTEALDTMAEFAAMWTRQRETGQPVDALSRAMVEQARNIVVMPEGTGIPERYADPFDAEKLLDKHRNGGVTPKGSSKMHRGPYRDSIYQAEHSDD